MGDGQFFSKLEYLIHRYILPVSILYGFKFSKCPSSKRELLLEKDVARPEKFLGSTGFDCSIMVHSASCTKLNSRSQNMTGSPNETK